MQKVRALFACMIAFGSFVGGVIACGDDDDASTFDPQKADDASVDTGPGFQAVDAAGDGAAPKCVADLPEGYAPVWRPPTKKTACTSEQLGGYYDACIASGGKLDAGGPCQTWLGANDDCGKCIQPEDNSGPVQWHVGRTIYTPNFGGCMAIARNEYDAGACSAAYAASIDCQTDACKNCEFVSAQHFATEFKSCRDESRDAGCKAYVAATTPACATRDGGPDAAADDVCFPVTGQNERTLFVRLEGVFCGP